MSKLDKEQVLEQFAAAYIQVNGKAPTIEAKGGWYNIDGGKNVRLAQIEELSAELSQQQAVTKTPAKKAVEKVKKPDKALKQAKVKSGFSVKAFWQNLIQAKNSGS